MCQRKTYSVLNFTLCILNAWSCFLRSRAFALDTGAVRMRWFLPMDAVCIWDLHCNNWWFFISSFSSSSFSGMVCQNKFSTKTRLLYHHIHSILKHICNLDEKNTWKRGKTLFVLQLHNLTSAVWMSSPPGSSTEFTSASVWHSTWYVAKTNKIGTEIKDLNSNPTKLTDMNLIRLESL